MSLFLLPESQSISCISKFMRKKSRNQKSSQQKCPLKRAEDFINAQLRKYSHFQSFKILEDADSTRYLLLFQKICGSFKGILEIKLHRVSEEVSVKLNLLTSNDLYFKTPNRHVSIQMSRNIAFHTSALKDCFVRIGIDINSGQIKMQLPFFNSREKNLLQGIPINSNSSKILYLFKNYLQVYLPMLQKIISKVIYLNSKPFLKSQSDLDTKIKDNIHRYNQMLMVSSHLSESSIETEHQISEKERVKKSSIRKLLNNKVKIQNSFMKSLSLMFHYTPAKTVPSTQRDFFLQNQEMKFIRSMIAMPIQPKNKNPHQNSMVLNHIFIHEASQLNKIGAGGFANIYLTQLKFWYVYSSEGNEYMSINQNDQKSLKNMLHKYVVVKKEVECLQSSDSVKTHSRNRHEINILKEIKNGIAIFLPKYYIPTNKLVAFDNDCILMDYIPFKNLNQFLKIHSPSLSLLSKLYLIFSIVQSLRYLRDYKIVHLDLKPNNIMIFCNMLVKLIDFGESYHPDICLETHKPGFTIPYSCPEMFSNQTNIFTSKSDIFSMGVILYQTLYGRFPFDLNQNTTQVEEGMQKYLSYWYFIPEEYQMYGDLNVLRILNGLISKCLAKNPKDRPELDWIALVIRQCFQLIH